jgi:hypothetical protein
MSKDNELERNSLTRRQFIKGAALSFFGLGTTACGLDKLINPSAYTPNETPQPEIPTATKFPDTPTPFQPVQDTPTVEPLPTSIPTESVLRLTADELNSKSDEELKLIAPKPNLEQLGFSPDTTLIPDIIIRGGEGANYVLYRNPNTKNIELAWNAETGSQEHAIYATYEKEIAGEIYKGIPCLFLTDQTVLDESGGGGWLGLNELFPDAEERLGNAFQAALGFYYWTKKVQPVGNYAFDKGLPNFEEIPGYENLRYELESIFDPNRKRGYNKADGPLRDKVAGYIRDYFLITLAVNKSLNKPMEVQLKAKFAPYIDLTQQKLIVGKFIHTGKQRYGTWFIWVDIHEGSRINAFKFITQSDISTTTLLIDQVRYDKANYLYGGHIVGFLRYFFGDYLYAPVPYLPGRIPLDGETVNSPEFTTGYATILCPPELQPEAIKEYYAKFGLPVVTDEYSFNHALPGQQSAIKFYKKNK